MEADDAIGTHAGKHLHAAVGLVETPGATVRHERERAHRNRHAARRGLLLRQTDARELGPGVDDVRDRVVVHVRGLPRHALDGDDALLARLVREHRTRDDVADGEHAGDARLEAVVHDDPPALVDLHAELADAEPVHVGSPSDRDEHDVGLDVGGAVFGRDGDAHAVTRAHRAARLGREPEREPLPFERTLQLARHPAVHAGQDPVDDLHDGHLGPEAAPDRAELEPHGARADDQHAGRHARQRERLGGADDPLAVERERPERRWLAAARDQHARGLERLLALRAANRDASRRGEARRTLDPDDLVLLEQRSHALGEAADDAVLPRHHRAEVELDAAHVDAVRAEPVACLVKELARVEQRLRRDAADVEARAAERFVLLDTRDAHAELRGPDGRHVAARPRADDDEVVAVRHQTSRRSRAGSSRRSFTRTRKVTACSPSTRR